MLLKVNLVVVLLVLTLNNEALSATTVRIWKDSWFSGDSFTSNNLDLYNNNKKDLGKMNDKMTSYKIIEGSCVLMYIHDPPQHQSGKYFATMSDSSNVGNSWNDKISVLKGCGSYSRTIQCPAGQYAKTIDWSSSSELRTGIELHCYYPNSLSSSSRQRTIGSATLPNNKQCNVLRGIQFYRHTTRNANYGMNPFCGQGSSSGYTYACPKNQALVGLTVIIEQYFDIIKSSSIICRDVGKIESTCTPTDQLSLVYTCDASKSTEILKCEHLATYGFGFSGNQTQAQRTEQAFYVDSGFLVDSTTSSGMMASFRSKIGSKSTTGFDWLTAPSSTFQRQTTATVRTEALPGCITKIFQVVGECAFMQVRTTYLQRVETCFGSVNN